MNLPSSMSAGEFKRVRESRNEDYIEENQTTCSTDNENGGIFATMEELPRM